MAVTGDELKIRAALASEPEGLSIHLLKETDSTNLRLKEGARAGIFSAPCLMIAECQSMGRGRLGRTFVSPAGTGLYMSILCRPQEAWDAGQITILAAVSVCRAIEELTALQPKIKWVNDLFLRGRKICGILAEAAGDQLIVGIGVNLITPPGGFPEAAGIAGALDTEIDRLELAGRITGHFLRGIKNISDPAIIAAYRKRMFLIGREIQYTEKGIQKNARVTGVDDTGGLMIRDAGGDKILRTGEVSLGSYSLAALE